MAMLGNSLWVCGRSLLDSLPCPPRLTFVFIAICSVSPAFGFMNDEGGHRGITRDALKSLIVDLASEKRTFSPDALHEIQSSVVFVDNVIVGEFGDAVAHCDDETLPECFQRVIDKREKVLNLLKRGTPDGKQARKVLGQALHTIQDFYSHSNWVHNPGPNKGDINRDFGVTGPKKTLGTDRATCIEGGLFEGNHVLTGDGITEITTGYFRKGGVPANKCNHGGPVYGGINKDARDKQFFPKAREFAVQATRVFVEQIFQDLQKDEAALRTLLGDR